MLDFNRTTEKTYDYSESIQMWLKIKLNVKCHLPQMQQ